MACDFIYLRFSHRRFDQFALNTIDLFEPSFNIKDTLLGGWDPSVFGVIPMVLLEW